MTDYVTDDMTDDVTEVIALLRDKHAKIVSNGLRLSRAYGAN